MIKRPKIAISIIATGDLGCGVLVSALIANALYEANTGVDIKRHKWKGELKSVADTRQRLELKNPEVTVTVIEDVIED